ncbi:hypothetical protein ACHAWO_012695 [Cyclotella atomus]|uniref:Uncharacterized protein n=1 Tax=Cyclotella atomus TaxID=382360 RepID=A0ABD3NWU1_9STRA
MHSSNDNMHAASKFFIIDSDCPLREDLLLRCTNVEMMPSMTEDAIGLVVLVGNFGVNATSTSSSTVAYSLSCALLEGQLLR